MTCVIVRTRTGYLAYIEELPGCVSTGAALGETVRLIRAAISAHFERDPDAVPL